MSPSVCRNAAGLTWWTGAPWCSVAAWLWGNCVISQQGNIKVGSNPNRNWTIYVTTFLSCFWLLLWEKKMTCYTAGCHQRAPDFLSRQWVDLGVKSGFSFELKPLLIPYGVKFAKSKQVKYKLIDNVEEITFWDKDGTNVKRVELGRLDTQEAFWRWNIFKFPGFNLVLLKMTWMTENLQKQTRSLALTAGLLNTWP